MPIHDYSVSTVTERENFLIRANLKYAIVLILVVLIGCGSAPTATPVAPAGPSATTISDGVWIVGSQVEPGTYSNAGGEWCYWTRLRGFSGQLNDIIANGISPAPQVVTIRPSDIGFGCQGCGIWRRVGP